MVELTVCFETSFNEAAERKTIKYEDIKQRAESAGYNVASRWRLGRGDHQH